MKQTIAYVLGGTLYLNITNRCTLACVFCPKRADDYQLGPHDLRLEREPTAAEVIAALSAHDLSAYPEVVFVGLGEPTRRLLVLLEVADWLHERGVRTRVNTDGLVNLVEGRDVTPEFAGRIDVVSVSLNAPDPATYAKLCPSAYGESAHAALVDFLRCARRHVPQVMASVVAVPGLDLAACRRLCESAGVTLRVRPYNRLGPEQESFLKELRSTNR